MADTTTTATERTATDANNVTVNHMEELASNKFLDQIPGAKAYVYQAYNDWDTFQKAVAGARTWGDALTADKIYTQQLQKAFELIQNANKNATGGVRDPRVMKALMDQRISYNNQIADLDHLISLPQSRNPISDSIKKEWIDGVMARKKCKDNKEKTLCNPGTDIAGAGCVVKVATVALAWGPAILGVLICLGVWWAAAGGTLRQKFVADQNINNNLLPSFSREVAKTQDQSQAAQDTGDNTMNWIFFSLLTAFVVIVIGINIYEKKGH